MYTHTSSVRPHALVAVEICVLHVQRRRRPENLNRKRQILLLSYALRLY
jgi:hypothetical protein